MARSCGLRLGPRRFELVVLDGNARKHKIVDHAEVDYADSADSMLSDAVDALRDAVKKHNVPRENVGIAIDSGLAAFRTLKLPVTEKGKIEQVLKFEVESKLPQWNIDDVVVDFLTTDAGIDGGDECTVITTAVRKPHLRAALEACERAGFDPLEAELETTAMVNAASAAGICQVDDAQVLVHVGELTTSVVVVDGGEVSEMRAIHIGARSHEARAREAGDGDADGATGGTSGGDRAGAEAAEAELADPSAEKKSEDDFPWFEDPLEVQRRQDQLVKRIRREIGRTISGARTTNEIDSIYVCGQELPDLIGEPIFDVPAYALDVFEEGQGQPAEGVGPLVVPYGVAVRQLGGGVLRPSLRREELRYAGTFEKLELPLAVVCLLMVTLLGVHNIFIFKQMEYVNAALVYWRDSSNNLMMGNPRKGHPGRLQYPPEKVSKYVAGLASRKEGDVTIFGDDPQRNRYEQMLWIKKMINDDIRKLEKDLGRGTEVQQPQSALEALAHVLGVMDTVKADQSGRPSLRKLSSTYQLGKRGNPDTVKVNLDITFFAENALQASQDFDKFKASLRTQPWYVTHEDRATTPLDDGGGINVKGFGITVNLMSGQA